MINFNIPPYVGNELENIKIAIANHQICGDGEFTKKCNGWIEKKQGRHKHYLQLPVPTPQKWPHFYVTYSQGMR